MAAVYPDFACAADYLPENVLVCISESSRASEGLKHWLWQRRQDIVTAEENGWLAGEFAHLQLEQDELVPGHFPIPGVPDGEPAHQPVSAGAPGHGAGGGQAAVRIRR